VDPKPRKPVDPEKQLRTLRLITWAMLVGAPIIYLVVAQIQTAYLEARAGNELLLYILLVVAIVSPATAFVVEWFQMSQFLSTQASEMQPINLFFTISIIKLAMVEATYIYGFVVFLMSGNFSNMLYFYPIGIIWTLVHWPRRQKYNQLIEKLNRP
jgi:F0F1-type ATP synthase membrane subunit c/vacuolar-type H+-ATPase subunit K